MKIRLTRPLPQPGLGRVIPAGVVIDAPQGLSERLLRTGMGEHPIPPETAPEEPQTAPKEARPARKKVKHRG